MQKLDELSTHELWLFYAQDDLDIAKMALKEERCVNPAIFHTQQCAEKSLKAYLAYKKQRLVKTHDLIELLIMCSAFDKAFGVLMKFAKSLNPHVTDSRYPGAIFVIPSFDTLKASIDEAEQVLSFVQRRVKEKN